MNDEHIEKHIAYPLEGNKDYNNILDDAVLRKTSGNIVNGDGNILIRATKYDDNDVDYVGIAKRMTVCFNEFEGIPNPEQFMEDVKNVINLQTREYSIGQSCVDDFTRMIAIARRLRSILFPAQQKKEGE